MSSRDRAKALLAHYMQTTMRAAGLKVDDDTRTELDELVDAIIDAANTKPAIKRERQRGGRGHYFIDGVECGHGSMAVTGSQIKASIPNFNPTFQVFLEGKGGDPDRLIGDSDSVDLARGAPKLYSAPPATFGEAAPASPTQETEPNAKADAS